ncbi:MAG: Na/Pi symporter [Saccharospirillum sp.]|nr:Na/Pi symporter [Saccharospirillum sp.]
MIATISSLIGGIGLFILGMMLTTDGLKAMAGEALRSALSRLTGSPWKALATGAGLTALVQSSSATTLATIGFVSAGLLSFSHAIGVIIGANLGTTSTGWIVALLGLKLSMGTILLPVIGIGALMKLLGRGKWTHLGMALAGFGVIFVGIDVMQTSMTGLADRVDFSAYSAAPLTGRLMLLIVGLVMSVLMQSSSAAIAVTITALATGTIGFDQAAAMVIGHNIGTTVTAILAAIGASTAAKRTALVHVLFNLGTGLMAFFLLPLFTALVAWMAELWANNEPALMLALFHTVIKCLGVAIFMPLSKQLEMLANRLLIEHRSALMQKLDPNLAEVPALALGAAQETLQHCAAVTLDISARRLNGQASSYDLKALTEVEEATSETGRLLARLPSLDSDSLDRLSSNLHLLDHINQINVDACHLGTGSDESPIAPLHEQAGHLADVLAETVVALKNSDSDALLKVQDRLQHQLELGADARPAILNAALHKEVTLDQSLQLLAVQRRLHRLLHHSARAIHYLNRLSHGPEKDTRLEADSPIVDQEAEDNSLQETLKGPADQE